MKLFFKENFKGLEQYFIFFLILFFFFPPFYLSFRLEHIFLYGASIFYFFTKIYNKDYFNLILKKKIFIFFAFTFLSLLGVLISAIRSIFILHGKGVILELNFFYSFLAVMDNYIQPVLLIFISIFFLSKNSKENIRCIIFMLISLGAVNAVYAIFEFIVIYFDNFCGLYINFNQSKYCNFIKEIDSIYNGGLFSDIIADYIERSKDNPNYSNMNSEDKLNALNSFFLINSNSVGWIALTNADRLSGFLNMPIQASLVSGSSIFLTIIFLIYEKKRFEKDKSFQNYIYIVFLLNILGAIITASKISFYVIFPLLFFIIIFFYKKLSFFLKKKLLVYYSFIFIIIMICLVLARWNGYNLYWSQIVKILQVPFSNIIKERNIFVPEQIIIDRGRLLVNRDLRKEYSNISSSISQFISELDTKKKELYELENKIAGYQIKEILLKIKSRKQKITDLITIFADGQDIKTNYSKNSSNLYTQSNFIMHYFTGGRLGIEPTEIFLLKKIAPIFGFGPIFNINFDNHYYYTLFNGGYFSILFYILSLLFLIYFFFSSISLKRNKLNLICYLSIFITFLIGSLGAPSYLLNTSIIYYYFPMAIMILRYE